MPQTTTREALKNLSDHELLESTKSLAARERAILADVLRHLAEIERRKLFSPRFQSLHEYATRELGYSEDQSSRRISAMRLLVELPEIEKDIVSGQLNLTTLNLARTHFRNEAAFRKDGQNADSLSQDADSSNLDHQHVRQSKIEILRALCGQSTRKATRTLIAKSNVPEKLQHFESVKPISATMNELRMLVSDETLEKIARLKGLLAHRRPHLSNGELLEIALDTALEALNPARAPRRAPRRAAESKGNTEGALPAAPRTEKPDLSLETLVEKKRSFGAEKKRSPGTEKKRLPGIELSRDIWRNAAGKCELCGSCHGLERDHIHAYALGGATTRENMRLLCRNCNQREAIQTFGTEKTMRNLRLKNPCVAYWAVTPGIASRAGHVKMARKLHFGRAQ